MAETDVNKALLRLCEDQCKAITIPEKHWPFTGPGQHWEILILKRTHYWF